MDYNQLPPELIKLLIETDEKDPELEALTRQMNISDALRDRALAAGTSKNAFGALAQGLAGYGASKREGEFVDKMRPITQRRQQSRAGLYDAMFPQSGKPSPDFMRGMAQGSPTLGRMATPDPEDEYPLY